MNALAKLAGSAKSVSQNQQRGLEDMRKRLGIDSSLARLKVTLLFDATGSMHYLWRTAREGMDKLRKRLMEIAPGCRLSCIAFRDYADGNAIIETCDKEDELDAFLSGIKCDGGGDEPEAVEEALDRLILTKSDIGILVGDAPPHGVMDRVVRLDYREVCSSLNHKGISVYTVPLQRNKPLVESFGEIASLTNGRMFPIEEIDSLVDALSVAVASRTNRLNVLIGVMQGENWGELTANQRKLLQQANI